MTHRALSRSSSRFSMISDATSADSNRHLSEAAYIQFNSLFLRDPLIPLAFLSIASQEGLDADVEFPGAPPRYVLYDCVMIALANSHMTAKTGYFDLLVQFEVEDKISTPNKMWQENSFTNLSLGALGRRFLDVVCEPIAIAMNNPHVENTKELRKRISIQFLRALIDNKESFPPEIRNVCRLIVEETRKHPDLFTLPTTSVANFILTCFLVPEIKYMSTLPSSLEAQNLLASVAVIIKMVANPELTTLDMETNKIVMEIRSDFTAELAALYDYLEKHNAHIAYVKREEEHVPIAQQKILEVFAQCHGKVEMVLENSPNHDLAEDIRAFFAKHRRF